MNQTKHAYIVRLATEDGKLVSAQLQTIGTDGKKSFEDIERGARGADHSMGAFSQTILKQVIPALSAGALIRATRETIKELGDLDDQAKKLSISAEKLQELRFLGKDAGLDENAADEIFGDFIRKVGEAGQGVGKLHDVLEHYNIELKDSSGRHREWGEILRDLSLVISSTGNEQEQMFIASRAGLEGFLDILRQGPEALDAKLGDIRENHVIFSDEVVAQAGRIDDEWERVTGNFSRSWKSAIIESLSWLEKFHARLTEVAMKYAGFSKQNYTEVSFPNNSTGSQAGAAGFQFRLQDDMNSVWEQAKHYNPKSMAEGQEDQREAKKAFEESIKLAEREAEKIRDVIEELKHRNDIVGMSAVEQEIYNRVRAAGTTLDSEAGRQIEDYVRQLDRATKATEKLSRASEDMGDAVSKNFEKMVFDGMEVGDMLDSLLEDIARVLYRDLVGDPLSQMVSGFVKDVLPNIFGGYKAEGGPVEYGKWYIAGEKGPEPIWGGGPGAFATGYGSGGSSGSPVVVAVNQSIVNHSSAQVETRQSGPGGRDLEIIIAESLGRSITAGALDGPMSNRFGLRPSSYNVRG